MERSAAGEGEADVGVDLQLGDAGDLVLDRVFDGDDLLGAVVGQFKCRVQRGALARAGGPGDQHDAVGQPRPGLEGRGLLKVHAQVFQAGGLAFLAQQAQHDGLTH